MKKKLLAILLCLTMLAGLLPTVVWAAEAGLKQEGYIVCGVQSHREAEIETLPSRNAELFTTGRSINTILWIALLFFGSSAIVGTTIIARYKSQGKQGF